jgi:hypothetical protein
VDTRHELLSYLQAWRERQASYWWHGQTADSLAATYASGLTQARRPLGGTGPAGEGGQSRSLRQESGGGGATSITAPARHAQVHDPNDRAPRDSHGGRERPAQADQGAASELARVSQPAAAGSRCQRVTPQRTQVRATE